MRVARLRGAAAIEGCVFDGALLARLREPLRPDGEVLVELAPPGVLVTSERIRLELDGLRSREFAWAYVGVDAIEAPAHAAGFNVAERREDERRWFARVAAR